jgi:transglutaminase-like putative cysteine protease
MRQLVQQGKWDIETRDLAQQICATVPAKDWAGELAALFHWVRDNIRYALDPADLETIQGAAETLALGYGDCDDFAVLLATLCECAGHPCAFAALGFDSSGEFTHVVTLASGAGESDWVCMDATEGFAFGWKPPGATCALFCPISPTAEKILTG